MSQVEEFYARLDKIQAMHPDFPKESVFVLQSMHYLGRIIEQRFDEMLSNAGLSATAWSVLMMLYGHADSSTTPSCLSDATTQSRTHMTRVVDELVLAGWLARQASLDDRRKVAVSLTPEGRALIHALLPQVTQVYKQMLPEMSPIDNASLRAYLAEVGEHLMALPPLTIHMSTLDKSKVES